MKKQSVIKLFFYTFIACALCVPSMIGYANFDDNDYELAITEKRYEDALTILNAKDEKKRTIPEKELITGLEVVMDVNAMEWPKNSMAMKEDEVDPEILKKVTKYYNASIANYLAGRGSVTRKILIQILFIYPDYPKAQFFLSKGFKMPPGSYKVADQVLKLVKRSDTYFYGGNYLKSAEDLEVLAILERDNPIVYEKLGSAYYMMNEKQKALDTWTTALFFNPDNSQLEDMITQTKETLLREAEEGSPLDQARANKVEIEDPQVMGVFKRQSEAFELMKELRAQGLTVAIQENDDGKWAVQVSRKELQEKNATKGSK
jgi:tetratricopeptide (TPR) repeat protein